MIKVAFKSLAGRRLRTTLTALAIVLGVAMVSAAFTITDTMRGAADSLSSAAYDGTDGVVGAKTAFAVDAGDWTAKRPTVDASLIEQARAVPGVKVAAGDITDEAKIIKRDGKPAGDGPYFGVGFDAQTRGAEQLTPFRLDDGRWATGPGEVVIDVGTAEDNGYKVGATVPISVRGEKHEFELVGVARFGSVKSLGTATSAVFDLRAAQQLFDRGDRVDGILVAGQDGVAPAELRKDIADALPQTQVVTAAKQDRFTLEGLEDFISIIRIALLAFGGVAILVGAFTIFNTLSITVAQRTRELGLLRMVGAYRRQVLGSVLVEALVIGAAASAIGLAAGYGLALALDAMFDAMGLALPEAGTVFAARTIVVSVLVGTLVTLAAGLLPAWRATRVAPVEALRASSHETGRLRLPARAARALASLLGRPAQAFGGAAGGLARRNAMRHPGRTVATATALTIGIALVTLVTVVAPGR
jgi:putative ABC transport system permease protein